MSHPLSSNVNLHRASIVEEELKLIADEQKSNVDELVALVKENESILALMRVSCINLCDLIYSQHITQHSF
jgi:hypothetical protein